MKRATPYLLIAPALFLSAFVILYPLYDLSVAATHQINRFGAVQGFTGFKNLSNVLADPLFAPTVWRTLVWTALVVGGSVVIALPIAMILHQDFFGRGLARVIIMLPWAVSLTMTAVVWRWAANGESGYLNRVLLDLGLISERVVWLAEAGTAFPLEIIIGILATIPFAVTVFLGGLSSIPNDVYEAARIDGANDWQLFTTQTLPLLKPFITINIVLNVIYVFNSFPIIWVLTEGGPADQTNVLVTHLYRLAFRFGRLGDAAALSLIMFALLLVFTLIYVALIERRAREARA
jgi:multiple sugar transport system permease protein